MKDVVNRALKTFWQAAVAYLVSVMSTGVDVFEGDVVKGLLIGAFAAGLSAVWNGIVQPMLNKWKGGR